MSRATDETICVPTREKILFIEPFYTGSHRQLIDTLIAGLGLQRHQYELVTMSGKKWHWRARTSALHLANAVPRADYSVLFTSSTTPLAELCGLRADLARPHRIVYFHENQLVYPVRRQRTDHTDYQYGYNQITTCMVADEVVFNSGYNMHSFLDNVNSFLNKQPDYKPKGLAEKIRGKCRVLYFPLRPPPRPPEPTERAAADTDRPLHILWPHRWEHDKNPELFFETLFGLHEEGVAFTLSVLGERYAETPAVFDVARAKLQERIANWGYVESRQEYWRILRDADVVVSTANHEFFGVAVLEAVLCGCAPLCVDALVYPELFPRRQLFRTAAQLRKQLRNMCRRPQPVRRQAATCAQLAQPFLWSRLRAEYRRLLRLPAEQDEAMLLVDSDVKEVVATASDRVGEKDVEYVKRTDSEDGSSERMNVITGDLER